MISPSASPTAVSPRLRAARRRVAAFRQKFGDSHLYFSYHAAFPLALTPELLYKLWANFQTDQAGLALDIPWIAVADLLLSGLCREVGHELYEMDTTVRRELLNQLQKEQRFGSPRIQQLAEFILADIHHQLYSQDPDVREAARIQRWTALAYIHPGIVTRELIEMLANLPLNQATEWLRITSLSETLADPLTEFQPLLAYARGMKSFFRGNRDDATVQLQALSESGRIHLNGVELPLPEQIQRNLAGEGRQPQPQLTQNLVANVASSDNSPPRTGTSDAHAPLIKLHLKLTPGDVIKANYFHIRKSVPFLIKLPIAIFLLVFILVFLLAIAGFLILGDLELLGFLFPVLCILFLFYFLLYIYIPRKIRQDIKRYRIFEVGSDLVISPDVVEETSEISMNRYRLTDCYMYRANSEFILLYLSMPTFLTTWPLCLFLPRRCFNSEQDFQQVLTYLKAIFGKPGKPLKHKSLSSRSLPYQAYSSFESTISFRVKITPEDYLKSNYLHLRPRPVLKNFYFVLLGIYLIVFIFTGYSAIFFGSSIGIFILLLLMGAWILYKYFIQIPLNVRRLSKHSTYLSSEHQVEISPEMLEIFEVTGTTRIRLADFVKYKFNKDLIVLYVTDRAFYIFPRRYFPSEEDFQAFLTYLQSNLGEPQP